MQQKNLQQLQKSLVLSHAAGTGAYMDDTTVRLMLLLKINALNLSGVRLQLIEFLIAMLNAEIYPCIPQRLCWSFW